MSTPPVTQRFPFALDGIPPGAQQAHIQAFNAILDLQRANAVNVAKIKTLQATAGTTPSTSTNTIIDTITVVDTLAGLGGVNDQTGQTSYITQTSDAGILLILNDASPVAVSLNSTVTVPYALFITNFGAGSVTLTPTTGTVNGGASLVLLQNQLVWCAFNGTNWKTSAVPVLAQSAGPTTHEWIASYSAATGLFTLTQPAYSDISGTPTLPATIAPVVGEYLTGYNSGTGVFSQSSTPGISATITTAALTTLGTQGSMTFVNGLLTAQVPAT